MLEIQVCEIRGTCPVHNIGDRIVIDGPRIVLEETDAVCVHALSSLLHYVIALDDNVDSVKLGLSKPEDHKNAYIQCVDPGEPYTSGGTVIFRCKRIVDKGVISDK